VAASKSKVTSGGQHLEETSKLRPQKVTKGFLLNILNGGNPSKGFSSCPRAETAKTALLYRKGFSRLPVSSQKFFKSKIRKQ
jgi:hypothetical protein